MTKDTSLLQAALIGYQAELTRIQQAMADIRRQLGTGAGTEGAQPAHKRKPLSKTALKHIRDAQKKRWAAFHAKEGPKAAKPKRKMSAATKKKLAANLAKARAAKAVKAAA